MEKLMKFFFTAVVIILAFITITSGTRSLQNKTKWNNGVCSSCNSPYTLYRREIDGKHDYHYICNNCGIRGDVPPTDKY